MPFPPSHPALDRALAQRGYVEPTSVQLAVVEADKDGVDLLVSAQTGSGKTVAFGLAIASTLLGEAERFERAEKPQALIIAPTRELAMQITRELGWLYAETGVRMVACVGGMSVRDEQRQLSGGAHIVIGTPGRLCDHLTKGYLDLSTLQVAVLDEADEMLDLGFREELETLLDATPKERRTLLFSATIARGIAMLAKNYQRDAVRIDTTSQTEPHGDIDYRAMRISPGDTERAVVNVLRYFEAGGALVFCATREAVRHLHAALRERGFHAVGLSGEMNQRERNDALQSLRDGHAKVCVATDVAARGLDLPDLGLVIHADLPTNKATLLHRSGRTGRAGRKGVSVLLVTHTKRRRTEQVLQSANITAAWSGPPTAAEIRAQDHTRLLDHPSLAVAVSEEDQGVAKQLAERHPPEQLAAALIGLLRAELPEPEDVSDDGRMRNAQTFEKQHGASPSGERGPPRSRSERGFAASEGDGVWFRLNIGRQRNADPKWILPLICRLGHITKAEIGPIRIFGEETKFEIVGHAAEAFAIAVRDTQDDKIQIEPTSAPGPNDATHPMRKRSDDGQRADRPPREDRAPREDRPPRETRDFGDRPPRPKREYGDRPQREPRTDARPPREDRGREDFKRSARDEARAARHQQRDKEQARLAADPVYSALAANEPAPQQGPPPAHPSGLNRRARRDAARAEGKIAPLGVETPKRAWSPDADTRPARPDRRPRPDQPRGDHVKPEGFKPRGKGPGGKPFKRGDKSHGAKPGNFKPRGPNRGKPKSDWRAK